MGPIDRPVDKKWLLLIASYKLLALLDHEIAKVLLRLSKSPFPASIDHADWDPPSRKNDCNYLCILPCVQMNNRNPVHLAWYQEYTQYATCQYAQFYNHSI